MLASFSRTITSPGLVLGVGGLMLLVWIGGVVLQDLLAPGLVQAGQLALGRDFIAFYGAGRLVLAGEGARLYEPLLQQRVQAAVLAPGVQRGFCYFVNPAFVALLYAPLALLPFRAAYYLHLVLMLAALLVALRWLMRFTPALSRHRLAVLLGCASSYPMIHTVVGGQNAALTLLLLSGSFALCQQARWRTAGVLLGLQLYKPQFALPLLGGLALRGRFSVLWPAALVALGLYGAGALVSGTSWPLVMISKVGGYYRQVERRVNGHGHIALPEAVDFALAQPLERHGLQRAAQLVQWVGRGLGLLALGLLLALWRRSPNEARSQAARRWGGSVALALLASLHTQYYDAALLLFSALLGIDRRLQAGRLTSRERLLLAAAYITLPVLTAGEVSRLLGLQPLVLVVAAMAWWAARTPSPDRPQRELAE